MFYSSVGIPKVVKSGYDGMGMQLGGKQQHLIILGSRRRLRTLVKRQTSLKQWQKVTDTCTAL
jgi:hypothetical protein